MAPHHTVAARAAALFASDLSRHCSHSRADVAAAVRTAIAAHGGVRGCLGEVAAAYGEYPETAVLRMRWARQTIEATTHAPAAASAMATAAASGSLHGIDEVEGAKHVVSSIA
jgi:hypothetical protein